jgi:hypothetical protein
MKEAVLLVLVCVLIVGGIGVWVSNSGSFSHFGTPSSTPQPAAGATTAADAAKEAKDAKEAPKKKLAAKAARKAAISSPTTEAPNEPLIPPVAEVVVAPPRPPAPRQFPEAREISAGAARENIAEKFGQPALATTTTSHDGRVLENLVYARKSGRDVTVIRIEDGKVLSAYSR